MTACALLSLIQIAFILMIGGFFGALIVWMWNYRDYKKQINYICKLEQTLNNNKIWIEN